MPDNGNSGTANIFFYSGDPTGVSANIIDPPIGSLVIDTAGGPARIKRGAAGSNANYAPTGVKAQTVASADGAIAVAHGTVLITKGSAAALTLASPTATTHDGFELTIIATTANAHTVTCTEGFGGGTTARDVATFGGAINDSFTVVAYNGVWYVKGAPRNVTIA